MSKVVPYIEWKDTVAFVPPITEGHVIKVYDGDTITIASTLPIVNSPLYRFSVRLAGIDSAEIKSKNINEKEHAKKVRDILSELILHKTVTLKNISTEKYGRILADVYLDDLFINKWMLDEGYAVEYNGGTKSTAWSEII
jgi:endonuclease YncB( thermonuclease family)